MLWRTWLRLAILLTLAHHGALADQFTIATASAAAAKGNPQAQYYLARHYARGDGVPLDTAQAAKWMRQAADQGLAFAQNDLGVLYAHGRGVPQDFAIAAQWYRRAAENGDALGQYSYGQCCLQGRGVPQDVSAATNWLQKAALQHQPDALLALGNLYFAGQPSLPKNLETARRWYEEAVAAGCVGALNTLGLIYQYGGPGVAKDAARAVQCYRQAAEQGDDQGQMNLACLYRDGAGVPRDLVAAYQWFYLASQAGNGVAKHYLQELNGTGPLATSPLITTNEITEALQRAEAFSQRRKH